MSLDRQQTTQRDHIEDTKRDSLPKLSRSQSSSSTPAPEEAHSGTKPSFNIRSKIAEPVVAAFIAGGVAGAVSRTIVSPLERLKILLQVQSVGREEYRLSIWKALVKMWREEGWKGFMRGNGTNCIRIVPYSAVQFGSYNFYKKVSREAKAIFLEKRAYRLIRFNSIPPFPKKSFLYNILNDHPQFAETSPGADLSPMNRLVCGGAAGITSVTITYPLDIVRTRLSIQSASFSVLEQRGAGERLPGMFRTMTLMYRNEGGIIALYRGIIPTVTGVAPYVGLNFMTYESVRKYLTPEGDKNPNPLRKLLAGAISGAVAQTCTYPFDVLRRRFQINTMSGMGYQYKSVWDAVRAIIVEEGLRGLFKGIGPNLLKVAPSMASSWLSFEMTRDFLASLDN